MKKILIITLISVVFFSLTTAEELRRLSLDNTSSLGMTIQTDTKTKVEGKGSIKITTPGPVSVCIGEVSGLKIENAVLVYSAKVRTKIEGTAYLEMWVYVEEGKFFSKGIHDPIQGRSDWKEIQTPFLFREGQTPNRVTLNLVIDGRGTVWIDDIVLKSKPSD